MFRDVCLGMKIINKSKMYCNKHQDISYVMGDRNWLLGAVKRGTQGAAMAIFLA